MRLADLPEDVNRVSGTILDAAITVHRALGPGLLESSYRECLRHELQLRGLQVVTEQPVPLVYRGLVVPLAYRADMIVAGKVIVELKALDRLPEVVEAQTVTYLRLTGIELGIILNFHAPLLREGFKRIALKRQANP